MEDYNLSDSYEKGLVSVIIPSHNRADIINETIESIFSQTYSKIELIIVDDHSIDNTECVINDFINISPLFDFQYYKSPRKGGCAARNVGLSKSRGEFIQFFDDDDIMKPNHIEEKVSILQKKKECDFVSCNFEYFKSSIDNIVGEKRIDNIKHCVEEHLNHLAFPAPSFLCRRNVITKIGFWDERILRNQDIAYFQRLFLYDYVGYWSDKFLFIVRIHDNNISSTKSIGVLNSMLRTYDSIYEEWQLKSSVMKVNSINKYILKNKLRLCYMAINEGYLYWGVSNVWLLVLKNTLVTLQIICKSLRKQAIYNCRVLVVFSKRK